MKKYLRSQAAGEETSRVTWASEIPPCDAPGELLDLPIPDDDPLREFPQCARCGVAAPFEELADECCMNEYGVLCVFHPELQRDVSRPLTTDHPMPDM